MPNKKNSKSKYRKKRKKKTADIIALLLIIVVLFFAGIALKDYILAKIISFEVARVDVINEYTPAKAYVFRHEYQVLAPVAGEFAPSLAEGERVKDNTIIGYIKGTGTSKTAVYATEAGIVSYSLDGMEKQMSADNLEKTDLDKITRLFPISKENDEENFPNQSKGRPVARIVDNLLDYNVLLVADESTNDQGEKVTLPEDGRVKFVIIDDTASSDAGIQTFSASIEQNGTISAGSYLLTDVSSEESYFLNNRYFAVSLITESYSGIVVPASAIIEKDGKQGVYIRSKNVLAFQEVKVDGIIGKEAVIEGVDAGTDVVENAKIAKEGRRIY